MPISCDLYCSKSACFSSGLPNVPAIEYPEERKSTNLRDQVLKPGYTQAKTQHDEKVDTDLDAKYVF